MQLVPYRSKWGDNGVLYYFIGVICAVNFEAEEPSKTALEKQESTFNYLDQWKTDTKLRLYPTQ